MKAITVYVEEEINEKLKIIARDNGRSRAKEAGFILKKQIQEYEAKYGEIYYLVDNKEKQIKFQ